METILIELARKHAGDQTSRGQWTNNVKTFTIEEGDEVSIQSSYIDLNNSNDNTVKIEEDFIINFSYIPYICPCGDFMPKGNGNNNNVRGDLPYYCVDATDNNPANWVPYEKTVEITISKGIYTPATLCSHVTDQMSYVLFAQNSPYAGTAQGTQGQGGIDSFFIETCIESFPSAVVPPPYVKRNYRFVQWSYPPNTAAGSPFGSSALVYIPQTIMTGDISKGNFNPWFVLGATQSGLAYENNAYKFFFLNPYYQSGEPSNVWCVEYSYDANSQTYKQYGSLGGIILTSIGDNYKNINQPFFSNNFLSEILGMNINNMVIPKNDFMTLSQPDFLAKYPYQNYVTTLKTSMALLYQNGVIVYINTLGLFPTPTEMNYSLKNFVQTGVTDLNYANGLSGQNILDLEGGGHFQLVLNSIPQNQMLQDRGRMGISALVPKQYTSSDTMTGFSNTSIPYIHIGPPLDISMISVAIISPGSRSIVKDTDLGDNSYVYLQVNKKIESLEKKM